MTTNSDMWKCPKCGLGPRDCKCGGFHRPSLHDCAASAMIAIALAVLLWLPVGAQDDPILGPGPCRSDTPQFCYSNQLFVPMVSDGAEVTVSVADFAVCWDWDCISAPVTESEAPCYVDGDGETTCG